MPNLILVTGRSGLVGKVIQHGIETEPERLSFQEKRGTLLEVQNVMRHLQHFHS